MLLSSPASVHLSTLPILSRFPACRTPRGLSADLSPALLRATEQFIVFDYADRYHLAAAEMARYVRSGELKLRETRAHGLDQCVEALVGIFQGKNTGKMLVKIGSDGAKL